MILTLVNEVLPFPSEDCVEAVAVSYKLCQRMEHYQAHSHSLESITNFVFKYKHDTLCIMAYDHKTNSIDNEL